MNAMLAILDMKGKGKNIN